MDDSDTAVITAGGTRAGAGTGVVGIGFGPEGRTASRGSVELELDVVVAIGDNGSSGGLETGLEVEGV